MPQLQFVWIDCDKLGATWSQYPDKMVIVDLKLSKPQDDLYFMYDMERQNQTLLPYAGTIDESVKTFVQKYFYILDYGGILYTEDNQGKRNARVTSFIMVNRKEFLLRLAEGVEKYWSFWRNFPDVLNTLNYLLSK